MLVEVARAEGSFFYTPDGKRYYDLVAGVSVSNVGHCNPDVVRAVQEQAARYMHVMVYGEMVESPQVTYAARIAAALPAPLDSVYFVNSGAEAVEGALKLAKRVTERTELVSMRRAYHGSTHGAMSMMGTPEGEEWKAAFRPLLPDVRAIEFNDFEALDRITRCTAAVLVEPVQGANAATARARCSSSTKYRPDWGARERSSPCSATASRPTSSAWPRPSAAECRWGRSSRRSGRWMPCRPTPHWDISPRSADIPSAARRDWRPSTT